MQYSIFSGQFLHQHASIKGTPKISNGHQVAHLKFIGPNSRRKPVRARLRHRRNMELQSQVKCWHVNHNGENLIEGSPEDYNVPFLMYRGFSMDPLQSSRTFPIYSLSWSTWTYSSEGLAHILVMTW